MEKKKIHALLADLFNEYQSISIYHYRNENVNTFFNNWNLYSMQVLTSLIQNRK